MEYNPDSDPLNIHLHPYIVVYLTQRVPLACCNYAKETNFIWLENLDMLIMQCCSSNSIIINQNLHKIDIDLKL